MFCDVTTAERIERAEQRLVQSAVQHVRTRVPGALAQPIGGGFAAYTEHGSPLNKVMGLGFAPLAEAAWEEVEREHARRGAAIQVEISTLGDPAIAQSLTARGYRLVGVENVLGRALRGVTAPPAGETAVTRLAHADLERWLEVVVTGFCAPDDQGMAAHEPIDREVVARVIRDFAEVDGVALFLATRAGAGAAGAASLRCCGTVAQLCGAATLPQHRRRGVQSALLAHRLAFAAAQGCELAVVTTLPGSKSMQNVLRQGFALLYSRLVLRREA